MLNTVGTFISWAKSDLLLLYSSSEAQQMIFLLLEEVKGFSRADVNTRLNEELTAAEWKKLSNYQEELMMGKPVQYILGHAWFNGMKFLVNEHVLIPRPETEELVDWLLSHIPNHKSPISVLDMGTGSGCIAIALKKRMPRAIVHAIDISDEALKIARKNADVNNVDVTFMKGDILLKQKFELTQTRFDIIVSNPPYIKSSEMGDLHSSVRNFEPHLALFVENDDPLIFYNSIAGFAIKHLTKGGKLFFEINQKYGVEIKKMLESKGYKNVVLKKDMSGNDRMVMGITNS